MAKKEKFAITPGGRRPKSKVHSVGADQALRRTPEGEYIVVKSATVGTDFVITPGGLRRRSLVHKVEPGAVLDAKDGRHRMLHPTKGVVADFGPLPQSHDGRPLMPRNVVPPPGEIPALGSGWITYASWTNNSGTPLTSFSTNWVVPPEPSTQSGQLLYLFNGIQNSTMIYQPVLQWGSNGIFGGNYWVVASWYADGQGGQAFYSSNVRVNPGDTLIGVMTESGQSDNGFNYNCEFQGIANTSLPIQNVEELTWCVETLECYGITQCSDYPASAKTAMASIKIQAGDTSPAVVWLVTNTVTDCGQHTLIFDDDSAGNGEVDLWYSPSPYWTFGAGTIAAGDTQDWWFTWGGTEMSVRS